MSKENFTQDEVNAIVQERLQRDRETRVVSEPRTYALDSPHSFYADVFNSASYDEVYREDALRRLGEHAVEVGHEIVAGSPEGRRAMKMIVNRTRVAKVEDHRQAYARVLAEIRTFTSGGGATASASGGGAASLVTPYFLLSEWAPFRGRRRPFADQCHLMPTPAFGMHVYVPVFTATTAATAQTEGANVNESAASAELEGAELKTAAARLVITQQLLDRSGAGGTIDVFLGLQILNQIEEEVDTIVLEQAIAQGKTPAGGGSEWKNATPTESSEGWKQFYTDLATAREELADTAGTRMRATHLFTTTDLYNFATRQTDIQGRPMIPPVQVGPPTEAMISADGSDNYDSGNVPKWARFTGTVLPGGQLWFTDDNIPASSGKTRLITSVPDESIIVYEDDAPTLSLFPETAGGELKVSVIERKYVAAVTRHAGGTATTTSAAYPTTLK